MTETTVLKRRNNGVDLPEDFPARLERFKAESGLSWRSRARCLGVSPYRIREWRRGTVPDSTHLFSLLTLAEKLGFRGIFVCPDQDMPVLNQYQGGMCISGVLKTT